MGSGSGWGLDGWFFSYTVEMVGWGWFERTNVGEVACTGDLELQEGV